MGVWTKTVNQELDSIFQNHRHQKIDEIDSIISFSCQSVRVAGQEVLRGSMSIHHKRIEELWQKYIPQLLLNEKLPYSTIFVSIGNLNIGNSLTNDSIVVDRFCEKEIINLVQELYSNIFYKKIDHYRSLENCNKLINHDIKIKDGFGKFTSLEGLPFRKVILAEAVNDPRSQEIKEAMRNYCEENYELGKKNNFEQLCRLKLVFDTMFPRDNINNSV